jgi:hypothetical protein
MDDLFLLVLAGHLLGDFVAQTDWPATNKEKSWRADLAHVAGAAAGASAESGSAAPAVA